MITETTPEALAQRFHETYERLAPGFGYETREASAVPWDDVPEANKALMVAVCAEILDGEPASMVVPENWIANDCACGRPMPVGSVAWRRPDGSWGCKDCFVIPTPTPLQETIVWGTYFARPDFEARIVEFGQVANSARADSGLWFMFDSDRYNAGWRVATVYVGTREERVTARHISALVPLTQEEFETAQSFGFDTSKMGATPAGRAALTAVFTDPRWEGDRT